MKKLTPLFILVFIFACDPCRDVDCENGTCSEGTCICEDGWEGSHCEKEIPCFGIDCGNNGTCVEGICECDEGWSGDFCDTPENAAPDAAISIWTSMINFPCNTQQIDVYIDGELAGSLTDYFESSPDCGAEGTVTVPVVHGPHTIYAECADGDAAWGGESPITIEEGYCVILELTDSQKSAESGSINRIR